MYNYYIDEKKNKERENKNINIQNEKLERIKRKSNFIIYN
jgi:hypothetical protein